MDVRQTINTESRFDVGAWKVITAEHDEIFCNGHHFTCFSVCCGIITHVSSRITE